MDIPIDPENPVLFNDFMSSQQILNSRESLNHLFLMALINPAS
jgi:hypothetical protein